MKKKKYELEYMVRASPKLLYNHISTSEGLSQWFADNVKTDGNVYAFSWEDVEQQAEIVSSKAGEYVRFRWLDENDSGVYFEFKIAVDEITSEVALVIVDFAEEDEMTESKLLWDSQVATLMRLLGT